jgi:hypothetical protein
VDSVAISPDGKRILTGSRDKTVKVWDAQTGEEVWTLQAHRLGVTSVAFSPDSTRAFAWDIRGFVLAWTVADGQPTDARNAPAQPAQAKPGFGPVQSPDGGLSARANNNVIEVIDKRLVDEKANHWPLPDAAARKRYHSEKAALAEQQKQWFAAAFHLDRLLVDDPANGDLKRRRELALKNRATNSERKGK